jgi:hypothetical protein
LTRCLRCDRPYKPRKSEHFCPDCSAAIKREKDRQTRKERATRAKEAIEFSPYATADWAVNLTDERLEDIGLALETGEPALVLDKMPDGANTAAGPNEGRSTFFRDLAGELDTLCAVASNDSWWTENPHALFEVHDPVAAALYSLASGLVCGDKRGTPAGYMRHYRAKEMACLDCTASRRVTD